MRIDPYQEMVVARHIVTIDQGNYLLGLRDRLRREHRFTWGWRFMREVRAVAGELKR